MDSHVQRMPAGGTHWQPNGARLALDLDIDDLANQFFLRLDVGNAAGLHPQCTRAAAFPHYLRGCPQG